jgi:hypothetical protein
MSNRILNIHRGDAETLKQGINRLVNNLADFSAPPRLRG